MTASPGSDSPPAFTPSSRSPGLVDLARHPELRFLEVSFTQVSEVGVRILRDYPANADIRFRSSAEAMDISGDVRTPLPEREMQAERGPFRWPRSSNDSRLSLRPQIPPATVTEESSHGDRETWGDDFEGAKTMPHTPHPPFGHPLPAAAGRGGDRQAESLTYFTVSPVLWARGGRVWTTAGWPEFGAGMLTIAVSGPQNVNNRHYVSMEFL
jgi:hypothetical protein